MIDAGIIGPVEEFRIPWHELAASPDSLASLEPLSSHGPRNVTLWRLDDPVTLDIVIRWVPDVPCITEAR